MSGKSINIRLVLVILAVFVILIKGVFAWTNPTQAPPGGSGAVTVSGSSVGIGTTSPGVKLEVLDGADSLFRLTRSGATNATTFRVGTDSAMVVANSGVDTITLKSGNVGIGTTSPGSKLEISGVSGAHALKLSHNAAGGWAPISMTNTNGGYTWFLGDGIVGTGTYTIGRGSGALAYINISGGDGNVGIGTTGPQALLHLKGAGTNVPSEILQRNVSDASPGGVTWGHILFRDSANTPIAQITAERNGTTANSRGSIAILAGGDEDPSTATKIIYLKHDGKVGIGTFSPTQKLTVAGTIESTSGGFKFPDGSVQTTAGGGSGVWTTSGTNIYNSNTGNVGIGTTGPAVKLEIFDSADSLLRLTRSGATNPTTFKLGIDSVLVITNGGFDTLTLKNGSVGIGTTSPGQKLTVAGTIESTSGGIKFPDGSVQTTATTGGGSGVWTTSGTNIYNTNTGNVGIGNSGPTYKLDVVSAGASTARFGTGSADTIVIGGGAGKITTGTVDPLYSIDGLKYATYLPGMTGQKEETTGILHLSQDESCASADSYCAAIDFNKAEIGSDVWLFYQITDLGNNWQNLVVLLTPAADGKVWYQKEPQSRRLLILGSSSGEVSYRLTAPRFDWQKWGNFSNEPHEGLVVPAKGR